MNKMRIMLIQPRYTTLKIDVRRCISPLGLAYLAAFLEREGHIVNILDATAEGYDNLKEEGEHVTYGLGDDGIKKRIKEFNPDIVGVSSIFSSQDNNIKDLLKLIRDMGIITITGGCHTTYTVNEYVNYADYVIKGEGELPTLQLINSLEKGIKKPKIDGVAYKGYVDNTRQYIKNLDDIPLPARHLLRMDLYFKINLPQNPYPQGKRVAQIITSRGCSARCVFCSTTNFWGNCYRVRSLKNIVEEMKILNGKYNIDEIQFTDDNITLNKNRAIAIFNELKKLKLKWCIPEGIAVWALDEELLEKMKDAGCYQLSFAVESGNQRVLREIIHKPLDLKKVKPLVTKARELGIHVHGFCILGHPGETISNMYESYNFMEDCNFDSVSFFIATPLIGSDLYDICKDKGYFSNNESYKLQRYKAASITTNEFTAEQVKTLARKFNHDYNKKDVRNKRFGKEQY